MGKNKPLGVNQPGLKMDDARRSAFLLALLETGSIRGAAARSGVHFTTVYRHAETDERFRAQIDEARGEFQHSLLLGILKAGVQGEVIERRGGTTTKPGDWRALAWILEHHPAYQAEFAGILRQKVEVGGNPDLPPIQIDGSTTTSIEIGPDTMERLSAVVQVLLRAGKLRLPDPGEVVDHVPSTD